MPLGVTHPIPQKGRTEPREEKGEEEEEENEEENALIVRQGYMSRVLKWYLLFTIIFGARLSRELEG